MDEPSERKSQPTLDPRLLEILVARSPKGGRPRLSGVRWHSDHVARGGSQAGGMAVVSEMQADEYCYADNST